jgi:hypothetical protein
MGQDTILTADDGSRWSFDNLTTQHWLRGHESGANDVVAWLMDLACEFFRDGKIEEACRLRSITLDARDSVVPKLRARAEQHAREFPAEVKK